MDEWSATRADIFACFRLLLGREPGEAELGGHVWRVGQPLDVVVRNFLLSPEFAARRLWQPPAAAAEAIDTEGFTLYVDPADMDVGAPIKRGAYEPEVVATFRRLLKPGMHVVDIGANIGFFSMLSALLVGAAGRVLAVEPNPANARLLEASRRANGFAQVEVLMTGAGRRVEPLSLHVETSNGRVRPAGTSPDEVLGAAIIVPVIPLAPLLRDWDRIDFLKIDVEGAEHVALSGCAELLRSRRPTILSEFSPPSLGAVSGVSGEAYLRFLLDLGYRIGVIGKDATVLDCGMEVQAVLDAFDQRRTDHVDILATPVG